MSIDVNTGYGEATKSGEAIISSCKSLKNGKSVGTETNKKTNKTLSCLDIDNYTHTDEVNVISSSLFDGRYSFILFRFHNNDGTSLIGRGSLEIKDGNILIEKKNRHLQSGPTDLYDTLSAQVDESGQVYGSITLDVLFGIDESVIYEFNGSIKDRKIRGKGPYDDEFEVSFKLRPIDSSD